MPPNRVQSSHIQTLPPELLGHIFIQSLAIDDAAFSKTSVPFLVSQVCAEWRAVTLSLPNLWSSLKVVLLVNHPCPPLPLLQLWLGRSNSQPLSLSLELDYFPPVTIDFVDAAIRILDIFASKSHHWTDLRLVLPGSYTLLRSIIDCSLPHLDSLDLVMRNADRGEVDDINIFLQNIPLLRRFSWGNRQSWGSFDLEPDEIIFPKIICFSLRHLILDSWLTLAPLFAILLQCQNLVSCDIRHFAGDPFPNLTTFTSLFHPHLESLKIYQHTLDEGLGALLDILLCPHMRSLSITCGQPTETIVWPQAQLTSFLSSCSMETLCLEFTGITEEELIRCLQVSTASLISLDVCDVWGTACVQDKLLTLLIRQTNPHDVLCPHLNSISLYGVVKSTDGLLTKMLQSRQHYLEHVDLCFAQENPMNSVDQTYINQTKSLLLIGSD